MTTPTAHAYTWDPVRDGWDIHDPDRRCYTCGARPSGGFGDGSPKYPSTWWHLPPWPDEAHVWTPVAHLRLIS